jgi:hypothetical protein
MYRSLYKLQEFIYVLPIRTNASVTGEVLGTPNARMKEMLTGDQPKLFTPWMAMEQGWRASGRTASSGPP